MQNSARCIALLTGASVSTLGLAVPVFAATTTSPGISHIVGPGPSVTDTLTICDLGDTCFFGVEATNSPAATAIVNSVPTGRIEQIVFGGSVTATMSNLGNAEMAAHATATAAAGNATAVAQINTGILQVAAGTDGGFAHFTNSGTLLIDAIAEASAAAGDAVANATIDFGFQQQAFGINSATAVYTNTGAVTLSASAHALAAGLAQANASVADAQYQIISAAGPATATFNNGGTMVINALASATGSAASAHALPNIGWSRTSLCLEMPAQ